MNRDHLRAFIWLRYRLRLNQLRRGGVSNVVILTLAGLFLAIAAIGLLAGGFAVGCWALADVPSVAILAVCDGLVVGLLFLWMIGLAADLQRTEALAIDKVLHLPVSPAGAFLVNYISSLASITLGLFVAGFTGLTLGLTVSHGLQMLLTFVPFVAFVFALTALTYQFQGWLASLMTNPRRRRTIVVGFTMGIILVSQTPQLANLLWIRNHKPDPPAKVTPEPTQAVTTSAPPRTSEPDKNRDDWQAIAPYVWAGNAILPPGWLPLAAGGLAGGNYLPSLLSTLGLTLIGAASLRRAYRTTLRLYTGQDSSGGPAIVTAAPVGPRQLTMVEWRLPGISEPTAAVATAALRSLIRAPEAKMILIAPVVMVVVAGGYAATSQSVPPEWLRPLFAAGGGAMVMLAALQIVGNQFGHDRGGFRSYVLSPVSRRDILLGKNLAAVPLVLGLAWVVVAVVGIAFPMRFDHFLAAFCQVISMALVFSVVANTASILAPLPIAAGAMKAQPARLAQVLVQMLIVFVLPVVIAPTFLPLGLEALAVEFCGVGRGWPIALAFSLIVLVAAAGVYSLALTWQGRLLQIREREILLVVTSKEE